MPREFFCAYHSYLEGMEALTDSEKGRLFVACLEYSRSGATQQLGGNERILFPMIRSQIDREKAEYEKKCAANRKNGSANSTRKESDPAPSGSERHRNVANGTERYRTVANGTETPQEKEKEKDKDEEKENTPDGVIPRAKFAPPTLEQVRAYIAERNSPVDPEEFVDFYASKGWKVGREPMRDWKAACRNAERWEKYRNRKAGASQSAPDEYSMAAVRQLMSEEVD